MVNKGLPKRSFACEGCLVGVCMKLRVSEVTTETDETAESLYRRSLMGLTFVPTHHQELISV